MKSKLLLLFSFFLIGLVQAQRPPAGVGGEATKSKKDSLTESGLEPNVIDTFKIRYFFPHQPNVSIWWKDSLLDNHFQQFDPTRRLDFDARNLGNAATAAQPTVFQTRARAGFDFGLHQFDVYERRARDLRFYDRLDKPFTDISASPNSESDLSLKALFARKLANNTQISLDYERISNIGAVTRTIAKSFGFQNFARARHVAFAAGIWKKSANKRYEYFLNYALNTALQSDNGGLVNDTFYRTPVTQATFARVAVRLQNAQTRHDRNEISLRQSYQLNAAKTDSAHPNRRAYLLKHLLNYENFSAKVYDNATTTNYDSAYYKSYFFDERGVRFTAKYKLIENTFLLNTNRKKASDTGGGDNFDVGIAHQFVESQQEGDGKKTQHNFALKGNFNWLPTPLFSVSTDATLFFAGANAGDYQLNAVLKSEYKNYLNLEAALSSQLYEPTTLQQDFWGTQRRIYGNSFQKTAENQLHAAIEIPKTGTKIAFRTTLLNNYVYFDSTFLPRQTGDAITILQLMATQNFKLGIFHFDNNVALQRSTNTLLQLPSLTLKHDIYAESLLSKRALRLRVGLNVRYFSNFFADNYHSFIGQFTWQRQTEIGNYPALDIYVSAKVQTFKMFVKMENLTRAFGLRKDVFYQVPNHPTGELYFRFGLSWKLSD